MIVVRKYFMLALLTVSCSLNAGAHDTTFDNDNGIVSSEANWHYLKQFGYGAVEGAALLLASRAFTNSTYPNTDGEKSFQALLGMCATFAGSSYIRSNPESNAKGAQDSSFALAWLANAGGYVVAGGAVAAWLMKK
jgi:hypothetical protein